MAQRGWGWHKGAAHMGMARLARDCDDATRIYATGKEASMDQRLGWRGNDAFAGQLAVSAVERFYSLTGGRGLSDNSPFQRA